MIPACACVNFKIFYNDIRFIYALSHLTLEDML